MFLKTDQLRKFISFNSTHVNIFHIEGINHVIADYTKKKKNRKTYKIYQEWMNNISYNNSVKEAANKGFNYHVQI